MGRLPTSRQLCGLVDVDSDQAIAILKLIADDANLIPKGINLTRCEQVPDILEDNGTGDYTSSRDSGGRGGRDRDSRGDRGGSGRSYNPRSYSPRSGDG